MTVVGQQIFPPQGRIGVQIANDQCPVQIERGLCGRAARIADDPIGGAIDPLWTQAKKGHCQCDRQERH